MKHKPLLPGQLRLILAVALIHVVAWFAYYGQIPQGQYLGPEEAARIQYAVQFARDGNSVGQPVTLYCLILGFLAKFNPTQGGLILSARILNAFALVTATGFSAAAAGHFWKRKRALWVTGLLVGLNPVLVFRTGELSPALMATACLAAAFWSLLRWLKHPRGTVTDSLFIASALTLGAAFEPAIVGLLVFWPFLALLLPRHDRVKQSILASIPLILLISVQATSAFTIPDLQLSTEPFLKKLCAFLNSFEPFDGKTYDFHNRQNLPLFLNPIHWGLLLLLAGAGTYVRFKHGHKGRRIYLMVGVFSIYGLLWSLLDVSSRARLPIIPLLAILAGGAALLPHAWRHSSPWSRRKIVAGAALIATLAYYNFYDVRSKASHEHDYALLAKANLLVGHNGNALILAGKALEMNPDRNDMRSVLVEAKFNEWAFSPTPKPLSIEMAKDLLASTTNIGIVKAPDVAAIEGIYLWKLHRPGEALERWQRYASESALAQLSLYWTRHPLKNDSAEIEKYCADPYHEHLQKALELDRSTLQYDSLEKMFDNIFAYAH